MVLLLWQLQCNSIHLGNLRMAIKKKSARQKAAFAAAVAAAMARRTAAVPCRASMQRSIENELSFRQSMRKIEKMNDRLASSLCHYSASNDL